MRKSSIHIYYYAHRVLAMTAITVLIVFRFSSVLVYADEASDFSRDVVRAEKPGLASAEAASAQNELSNAEYASSWDEFGTSPVIDGALSSDEISAAITSDIAETVSAEQHYDATEVGYLEATGATPEQIVSTENRTGSDVPPGETIDPNPSLSENPDANVTVAEDLAPEVIAAAGTESAAEPSAQAVSEGDYAEARPNGEQAVFEAVVTGDPGFVGATEETSPVAPSDAGANETTSSSQSGSSANEPSTSDSSGNEFPAVNFQGDDAPTGASAASSDSSAPSGSSGDQNAQTSGDAAAGDTNGDSGSNSSSDSGGTDSSSPDSSSSDSGASGGGDSSDSSSASVMTAFRGIAPAFERFFETLVMPFKTHL